MGADKIPVRTLSNSIPNNARQTRQTLESQPPAYVELRHLVQKCRKNPKWVVPPLNRSQAVPRSYFFGGLQHLEYFAVHAGRFRESGSGLHTVVKMIAHLRAGGRIPDATAPVRDSDLWSLGRRRKRMRIPTSRYTDVRRSASVPPKRKRRFFQSAACRDAGLEGVVALGGVMERGGRSGHETGEGSDETTVDADETTVDTSGKSVGGEDSGIGEDGWQFQAGGIVLGGAGDLYEVVRPVA
ncbi:hypothetical protein FB451DRAFT_1164876 [Mycena latifolia]|nr:hypothetical protein FB451DRAFT_1164876 [Mycena latifolia]